MAPRLKLSMVMGGSPERSRVKTATNLNGYNPKRLHPKRLQTETATVSPMPSETATFFIFALGVGREVSMKEFRETPRAEGLTTE